MDFVYEPGAAGLLPDEYFFVLINPLPAPYDLRSFCLCAIEKSGGGCMRRPRPRRRAPRRNRGTRSAGSRNDDGGGGGSDPDPDSPPRLKPRAAGCRRFRLRGRP